MNEGRTVFSQLMDSLPRLEFNQCVERYQGDHRTRSFSCLDQFLCMAFAQLTYRESLRDIETCLRVMESKLYHAGIRGKISRSTLADANEKRSWQIYADFAQVLIGIARQLYADGPFALDLDQTVYALDSTTIDLCLELFPWARFRKHKGAIKLHTLLDLRGNLPTTVIVTTGKVHDINILDQLTFEPAAIYIMDRGYVDFARLYKIDQTMAFFITRAKSNFDYHRLYSYPVERSTGLRCDQTILLNGIKTKLDYPDKLRRIRYYDTETNKRFTFLTNNFPSACRGHRPAVQMPLADRTFLQMDQTAFANQSILWNLTKRCEDSNLDFHLGLCSGVGDKETTPTGSKPLHNSTDFESQPFRKNAHFPSTFTTKLYDSTGSKL